MKVTKAPIAATIRPKRMIGDFHADVTIEESVTDQLEITQHPVQQGASVTDHAYVKPVSLNIQTVFGDTDSSLVEMYQKLLKLQASRIPIDVVTGKRIYKNMLIESLGQTTNSTNENVLNLDFTLREIILTSVQTVLLPERSRQARPEQTGQTHETGEKSCPNVPEPLWARTVNKGT